MSIVSDANMKEMASLNSYADHSFNDVLGMFRFHPPLKNTVDGFTICCLL